LSKLTLRLVISYIYGAPSKAPYIYIYIYIYDISSLRVKLRLEIDGEGKPNTPFSKWLVQYDTLTKSIFRQTSMPIQAF